MEREHQEAESPAVPWEVRLRHRVGPLPFSNCQHPVPPPSPFLQVQAELGPGAWGLRSLPGRDGKDSRDSQRGGWRRGRRQGGRTSSGKEAEERSRGCPARSKMKRGSALWRKGESLHGASPGTWYLHLRGVSSRVVIQSQDAEGIADTWVQAPQPPAPALWLNVSGCGLPSPSSRARGTGPPLHQEARQVPRALHGPLQLHLPPVSPIRQAADGDVGRSWVSWG